MQTILSALAVIVGLLLAAFGLGRSRGKITAESAAAAAERASVQAEESAKHVEVLKNAVDVQQGINRQPDSSISDRLRQKWRREAD